VKVSFNTRIRYNGREYSTVDDLPETIRAKVELALDRETSCSALDACAVFNGRSAELPESERRLVESSLHAVLRPAGAGAAAQQLAGSTRMAAWLLAIGAATVVLWRLGLLG
jgi:hypothetical protein